MDQARVRVYKVSKIVFVIKKLSCKEIEVGLKSCKEIGVKLCI
jgi:hypothetical protein